MRLGGRHTAGIAHRPTACPHLAGRGLAGVCRIAGRTRGANPARGGGIAHPAVAGVNASRSDALRDAGRKRPRFAGHAGRVTDGHTQIARSYSGSVLAAGIAGHTLPHARGIADAGLAPGGHGVASIRRDRRPAGP